MHPEKPTKRLDNLRRKDPVKYATVLIDLVRWELSLSYSSAQDFGDDVFTQGLYNAVVETFYQNNPNALIGESIRSSIVSGPDSSAVRARNILQGMQSMDTVDQCEVQRLLCVVNALITEHSLEN